MGYFQVRYDSRVVIYYCRGFIRLATGANISWSVASPLVTAKKVLYNWSQNCDLCVANNFELCIGTLPGKDGRCDIFI